MSRGKLLLVSGFYGRHGLPKCLLGGLVARAAATMAKAVPTGNAWILAFRNGTYLAAKERGRLKFPRLILIVTMAIDALTVSGVVGLL
jgi:hypothetical protein